MTIRNKTGPRAVLLGLLLASFLCGNPQARGGGCIGADRARIVRLFEILSYQLQKMSGEWTISLQAILAEFPRQAAPLGVFVSKVQFRHESRETVRQLLTSANYDPDKIAGELKKLAASELAHLKNIMYHQELPEEWQQEFTSNAQEEWRHRFALMAGVFHVCRAVREKDPHACDPLDPLGNDLKRDCKSLVLRVGILFQGNCSKEAIDWMAENWNREASDVRIYCQAIKDQRQEACASMSGVSPADLPLCRALAGGGETACNAPGVDQHHTQECRNEVRVQQAAGGKIPLNACKDLAEGNNLRVPALFAVRTTIACDELALEIYDKAFPMYGL